MRDKVKGYVDNLFSEIYQTKELNELKEEITSNLLEKIKDFIDNGHGENEAFNKAVSDLGDTSELVEGLKKASKQKIYEDMHTKQPIDKKHVFGYVIASTVLLFGIMLSGITYSEVKDLLSAVGALMPFIVISTGLFVYFGLTQETKQNYGMKWKRAMGYSLATMMLLLGILLTGLVYLAETTVTGILGTFMVLVIPSVVVFIYLGLTEKSRSKINWEKHWIEYYSDPKTMMVYGNISGALWIFAFGAIPLVGFRLGWIYAWVPFVIAIGVQLIIEAIFASKKK